LGVSAVQGGPAPWTGPGPHHLGVDVLIARREALEAVLGQLSPMGVDARPVGSPEAPYRVVVLERPPAPRPD
jgi:hypothetical protein